MDLDLGLEVMLMFDLLSFLAGFFSGTTLVFIIALAVAVKIKNK